MCEVNVAKFNSKPHFGDVKVGDMFQGMNNYWYMKVKIKDGRTNEQTILPSDLKMV